MSADSFRAKIFSRRLLVLSGVQAIGLTALVGRLVQLQVIESDKFSTKAESNRISVVPLSPERSPIFDRYGEKIATNLQNFNAVILPERAREGAGISVVLQRYGEIMNLSPEETEEIIKDVEAASLLKPILVSEQLTWDQVAALEVASPSLPGVQIVEGLSRLYPMGATYAHIVGYVGRPTAHEVRDASVLNLPGMRIGRTGVEASFEESLRGTAGNREVEVDAFGRELKDLRRTPAKQGKTYTLTVDTGLQEYTLNRLALQRSAAAVVMDIVTGDVYAMVSIPGFDPNMFVSGISWDEWNDLSTNTYTPLVNKAVSGRYAPGSTFKLVSLLAGLEDNIIKPTTRVTCTGRYEFADQYYHCWARYGHGEVGPRLSIAASCDIFFYHLAEKLGIDKISTAARKFGFGSKTGLGLKGEASGLVPDGNWKSRIFDTNWLTGDTLITSIGQGYMLATPIQLAQMTARIASGNEVRPRLIKAENGVERPPEPFPSLEIGARNLRRIHSYMIDAVEKEFGTAYKVRIRERGKKMAAKTGTSQVRRISLRERETGVRKNKNIEWNERDHALFVAFAPVKSPRYACAVVVEHGGSGGVTAGPIARDILLDCQFRNPAGI